MSLNVALLAISGASVFFLLQWRAAHLPAEIQQELRSEVLVARGVIKQPDHREDIAAATEKMLQERLKEKPIANADMAEVRQQIRGQMKAEFELAPPGYSHRWQIDLGHPRTYFQDEPMQLRIKFHPANNSVSGTFQGLFQVGDATSTNNWQSEPLSLAPDAYHELAIPANLCDEHGILTIYFANPNDTALSFPLEDGMEVLYPEGGFALNFARGLGIILCWMALLAALGLTAASFLSFPVAAFFSLGMLLVGLSSGTLADAVDNGTVAAGNEETGVAGHSAADVFLIPAFQGVVAIVGLAKNFSPIDALSTGLAIPWSDLGAAFFQIVVVLGGAIALIGMFLFSRRELATAQGTQ
jgi:hypothetical protein